MGTVAVAPANAHCANPGTQQSPVGQQFHSQQKAVPVGALRGGRRTGKSILLTQLCLIEAAALLCTAWMVWLLSHQKQHLPVLPPC